MSNPRSASAELPESAAQIVETMIKNYQQAPGLSWIHGQGSVFSRFTDDSDLDFVICWDAQPPDRQSLPTEMHARITPHESVVLEQTTSNGYDLDVMHIPLSLFHEWVHQLEAGQGWRGADWPLPIYAASGLAHGVVLLDPTGKAKHLQDHLHRPPMRLAHSVRDQLEAALTDMLAELERCASRGDHWLHQNLAVQLLKIIYTGWFVAEGHLPPFPKRLPAWFERLAMDPAIVRLERACWESPELDSTTSAISAFGNEVRTLLA